MEIRNKRFNHTIEIIGLIITMLISLVLYFAIDSKDIAYYAGILSVWIFWAILAIKIHISKLSDNTKDNTEEVLGKANILVQELSQIKAPLIQYAKCILDQAECDLENVKKEIIPLSEQRYYQEIIKETETLKEGDEVISVNTIDERRFFYDEQQQAYFDANSKAIEKYKIKFVRIFVVDFKLLKKHKNHDTIINLKKEDPFRGEKLNELKEIIERIKAIVENYDKGIIVKLVNISKLKGHNESLSEDGVLFLKNNGGRSLYIGKQGNFNKSYVLEGELRLSDKLINEFMNNYSQLSKYSDNIESEKMLQELLTIDKEILSENII